MSSTNFPTVWSHYGISAAPDDRPLSYHWQTREVGYWATYNVRNIVRFASMEDAREAAAKYGPHREDACHGATTYPFYAHELD